MHEPSGALPFSEDAVIRAFHAAHAFRDALQTLVTVAHSAGFTVGMEAEDSSPSANGGVRVATSGVRKTPFDAEKASSS